MVGTTHDVPGAGAPRLVLEKEHLWAGEAQPVFALERTETTIGSADDCDIVLPDLAPRHARVLHTLTDEYLLSTLGAETRVHGAVVEEPTLLRTGARIDLGSHVLAFVREEHADHGRPFGGREGGEIGHQRPQPPRSRDDGRPRGR